MTFTRFAQMGHVLQKEVQQKYSNPRVITLPKFNWLAPENGRKMIFPFGKAFFKGYLSFKQSLEILWDKCEQAKAISNAGFFFHQQYICPRYLEHIPGITTCVFL